MASCGVGAEESFSDLKVLVSRKLVDLCVFSLGGVVMMVAVNVESLIPGEVLGEEKAERPVMVSVGRVSRGESPDNEIELNGVDKDRTGVVGGCWCCECNMLEVPESNNGFAAAVTAIGEVCTAAGEVRENFKGSVVQLRSKSRDEAATEVICRFWAWMRIYACLVANVIGAGESNVWCWC